MNILSLKLQRLGKRKIKTVDIEVEGVLETLSDLLRACVKNEVSRYNKKRMNLDILPFLSPENAHEQSLLGKVTFRGIKNESKADLEKSRMIVFQAFKDGLFTVFIDEKEIKSLETRIRLEANTKITFLKLTFLTGTFW